MATSEAPARRRARPSMSIEEVRGLPVAVDVPTAARAFGIGRTVAFELARTGGFPCPVRQVGRRFRVLKSDLLAALGITDTTAAPEQPTP